MLFYRKYEIADNERGLLFRKRRFVRVLNPGTYRFLTLGGRVQVDVFDVTALEFAHPLADLLARERPKLVDQHFDVFDTNDYQVGLVYREDKLIGFIPPGSTEYYWKRPIQVRVEIIDTKEDYTVSADMVSLLGHARAMGTSPEVAHFVHYLEVPNDHIAMLYVNGVREKTLQPGNHAFWKVNRSINTYLTDLRQQALEVSGQEILTKDKVSLRINLAATYRITDPETLLSAFADHKDFLYRELQFGLREAVGTKPLDELLENKDQINEIVQEHTKNKIAEHGVELISVGVKDVILPGDMKEILNQVMEAEKSAQANLIKRREETAATRSLHNTAKMMENNPTLLRLKELETLEKVTERIDKLTVFGGLDGVLSDLVQIKRP